MRSARSFILLLLLSLLSANVFFAQSPDDEGEDDSDITARVARISFERGDAQLKRSENKEWERASLNLPLVEGDEITTGVDARLEIQFSRDQFLQLAENSYLKITSLRDEGISVSLSQGTMSIRVLKFDKDKEFFEIDAPKSTISIQKSGLYRIDAGDKDSKEIRVTVNNDGQARIYSEDSGFLLRSGRSTKIYLDGDNSGENEIAEATRFTDEWDTWVAQRDAIVAQNLKQAHYDKYYDREMYGAEILDSYGEWIETKTYGRVWRPNQNATADYADWTPYRYGQWRWIPPYGWTWVNDEPWGWATYHHGRWIYEDNYWAWTPYPQHRSKRSWWKPALVVVVNISNDICWYPLPHNRRYRNLNRDRDFNARRNDSKDDGRRRQNDDRRNWPYSRNIPSNGVVAVRKDRFGNGRKWVQRASDEIARKVLTEPVADTDAPSLPRINDSKDRFNEVFVEKPRPARVESRFRTGATDRRAGVPLDGELRQNRVWNNRTPIVRQTDSDGSSSTESNSDSNNNRPPRRTGAFERPPRQNHQPENNANNNGSADSQSQPVVSRPRNDDEERRRTERNRNRDTGSDSSNNNRPQREERKNRSETPREERRERNQSSSEERKERPQREERRSESSRSESPKREERREESKREEPKREEPKREEPKREERREEKTPDRVPPKDDSPEPTKAKSIDKDN